MSGTRVVNSDAGLDEKLRIKQILMYAALLAPVSVMIAGDGVSANYLFMLLLLAPLGFRKNRAASLYVFVMAFSYLIGLFIFSSFDEYFMLRQSISFGLALVGALLLFVRLRVHLEEFLVSAVIVSVLYSTFAIYMVATKDFSLNDVYLIKGGLREYVTDWPQRYVVVLIFAFFVALERVSRGLIWLCASLIILTCIFLTFTRSAWLGVFGGLIAYVISVISSSRYGGRKLSIRSMAYVSVGAGISVFLLVYVLNNDLVRTAFMRIIDNLLILYDKSPSGFIVESSEGTRLYIWSAILNVLGSNPLTGTGFAGIHLFNAYSGSAHSQYMDILLRTGILGLLFYLYFWKKLLMFFVKLDPGIFAGLVAVFVFGFFHETTKLSYGALLFYVLLNKVYEADSLKRKKLVKRQLCAAS